jgi:hypothetical protein
VLPEAKEAGAPGSSSSGGGGGSGFFFFFFFFAVVVVVVSIFSSLGSVHCELVSQQPPLGALFRGPCCGQVRGIYMLHILYCLYLSVARLLSCCQLRGLYLLLTLPCCYQIAL